MLLDLSDVAHDAFLDTDIGIAGAGAAGITLARALRDSGLQVTLLESGGLDHDADTQALGAGENIGMPYYELHHSRLRFFGGTTNIWGGRCTPLDSIDFEHRPWVPHSGWPITLDDLSSGYQRAHQDLEIGPCQYDSSLWQVVGCEPPAFDEKRFSTSFWRFDRLKERFSAKRCRDLFRAPDIRVITHANVVHLQADANANNLSHITFCDLGGKRANLRAKAFVLACGGIENSRLLLASRDVEPNGIGNRHDQVGRYFMEHAHGRLGHVRSPQVYQLWKAFHTHFNAAPVPLAPVLKPAPTLQRRREILNTALTFKWQRDPKRGIPVAKRLYQNLKHQLDPSSRNRRLWNLYRSASMSYQRYLRTTMMRGIVKLPNYYLNVMIRAEQAPNPASRVTLTTTKDALGMPKANLDWQLSSQDKATLRQMAATLDDELQRLGMGRFEAADWLAEQSDAWPVDPTVGNHPIGGYHHMGTTRMSDRPTRGVVDADCRVHGYANLYVAGSSVFSTSGWANPTLTILALTYLLKDHLLARLK